MNFLFLSIISCLLLSHTNYASQEAKKTGWKYSWPIATFIARTATSLVTSKPKQTTDTTNAIPKTVSQKKLECVDGEAYWTNIDKNDAIDFNNIDPTLIQDYYQTTPPVTSPISSSAHSPNRKRSQSFSGNSINLTNNAWALCDETEASDKYQNSAANGQISKGAILFSKTIENVTAPTASSASSKTTQDEEDDNQCFLSNICKCCFKKNQ